MSDLDTIWIIDSNGLSLVQQVLDPNSNLSDRTMFSGFISALLTFSDSVFDDQFEFLQMGKLFVHILSFMNGKFLVAIAAKKDSSKEFVHQKLVEVGEAFEAEYSEYLKNQTICIADEFIPFTDTLDKIFGTKTLQIIPEHEEFLNLLKRAEEDQYTEELTVEVIIDFFKQLPKNKRKVLLQTTLPIISMFTESDTLSVELMQKFQEILI